MQQELEFQYKRMKQRERFVLSIYSLNASMLLFLMYRAQYLEWLILPFGVVMVACWIQTLANLGSYRYRAYFIAIFMQVVLLLYSLQQDTLLQSLPLYMAIMVILGLYEIPDLILVPLISVTLMILIQATAIQVGAFATLEGTMLQFIRLLSVYCAHYALYNLMKRQQEHQIRLNETIEDLKVAEESKDDFLANVSHEIRTPINTICGISEIILREDLTEGMQENVYTIQNAGRNLLSVVSDILDFSELQSGNVELVEESYNISSTLNDVINMSMAKIYEKPLELLVDCDANMPAGLLGDEQKLRRVIMNLVGNAIKFTIDGCVSIRITCRRESYGINLVIGIKDTGIGMTKESLEKLFTSFNQVDTKRNRREEGIGLGLAISQAIVQKMGGFLTIRSEYGKGTEVQFVVPQRIENDTPIVSVYNTQDMNVAICVNMEQFEAGAVREEYSRIILRIIAQLNLKARACRDLDELRRRAEREQFTHIFISMCEYQLEPGYFDQISKKCKVIVVIDQIHEKRITNPRLQKVVKPIYLLNVVSALNGEALRHGVTEAHHFYHERFIAPDARILVVDDNIMNIRVLEGLLKPYQIAVTVATSGRQALDLIEAKNYDFVFMDHMMPEMDGIETLQHIRKKIGNYFKEVPIIALTANAIAGTREMFLREGFQDYVAKPIELSVLERVLKRHIPAGKIVKVLEEEAIEEKTKETKKPEFVIGDFDVEKAISYCGSLENYIEALRMHYADGEKNCEKIQHYFDCKDWKNYTILVHALKSSMASIGVTRLSEMAKTQEFAGKADDVQTLLKNHDELIMEYQKVLSILTEHEMIGQFAKDNAPEPQAEDVTCEELTKERLAQLVTDFEDAAYGFDEAKLMQILDELQKYTYHGRHLDEDVATLRKKVQMSDYMSALSVLAGWK